LWNSAAYWEIFTLISVASRWRMQLLLAIVAERWRQASVSTTRTVPSKSAFA
jgi:hypothetical protein